MAMALLNGLPDESRAIISTLDALDSKENERDGNKSRHEFSKKNSESTYESDQLKKYLKLRLSYLINIKLKMDCDAKTAIRNIELAHSAIIANDRAT